MLYYHFGSKQALYRSLLRRTFADVGALLQEVVAAPVPAEVKIERVIARLAAFVADHSFFPAIMMREVAEGGAHLDRETLKALASLPQAVGAIVAEGVAQGTLRPVHPMAAYFTMFAPIMMYLGGSPIREQLTTRRFLRMKALTPDVFIRQFQESVRLAFAAPAARRRAPRLSTVSSPRKVNQP